MNVGQIAKDWYAAHEPEGALSATILRCFFHGVIICRPNFLLMAETCWCDGTNIDFRRLPHSCWWIYFWTTKKGAMSSYDLCLEAPIRLDWVAFKRRGKIKIIAWDKLYNKDIYYGRRTISPSTKTT